MADPRPPHTNFSDVRMRGFARRSTVEQALEWLDQRLARLPAEQVPLNRAAGRVLAEDIQSPIDVPLFERAMMDGYALRAEDTLGASSHNRLLLHIVGEVLPGREPNLSIAKGLAARIMTGAPLPRGANAVLPAEQAEVEGECVFILEQLPRGKNVGHRGEDIAAGATVLSRGRRLRPQDIGVLSSIGCSQVVVIRQPRVRIIVTGNELLPAGTIASGCQIADANSPMLMALVERDGGVPIHPGIVRDRRDEILSALRDDAEVVLVSGGSSVGQEDHAPSLLAEHGQLAIHGIAMRPGGPAGIGILEYRLVFLLPGNPVSCLCAYDFFAGRAIRALGGRDKSWPYRSIRLPLSRKLVSLEGRVDYARVSIEQDQVEPLAISGASALSSTTRASGFVIVPADSEGYPAGAIVDVFLYDV